MGEAAVMAAAREGLMLAVTLSLPVLLACLVTGIVLSLLQAVTQVQDQSVSFVPKAILVGLLVAAAGPAALREITSFARMLFSSFGGM